MKLAYDVYEPDVADDTLNPIILLHGMMESRKTWKPLGKVLAQKTGRKVYAVDARNHGESPCTMDYSYRVMGDDIEEFMDDHGIEQAVLIGHSMGGKTAISYALRKPEKVEMIIVEDVPVRNFQHSLHNAVKFCAKLFIEIVQKLAETPDKAEAERFVREMGIIGSDILMLPHDLIMSYAFENLPFHWDGNKYLIQINVPALEKAILTNTLEHPIEGVYDGESLFLIGDHSQFKAGKDPMVEKHFPKTVKVFFKNAGHFIHAQFPSEFLQEVTDFINGRTKLQSKY